MKPTAHVAAWKKAEVHALIQLLQQYTVLGLVDMNDLPSYQLQKMRAALGTKAVIKMTKTRLLNIALTNLDGKIQGINHLKDRIQGMPALICTNENPFSLAKTLRKAKSKAPAKPGQKAPHDLTIPAGPTTFAPGPVIGELGQLGLKTQIQEGKIHIKEDKIIAHEGDVISANVASMLTRLGIEPMEIGLNLVAVLENGMIYLKNVLDVDEKVYLDNLRMAAAHAFALAFSIAYPTKQNIALLIKKASRDADALAASRDILTSKRAERKVNEASGIAKNIAGQLHGYTPEETPKTPPVDKPQHSKETPPAPLQSPPSPSPPPKQALEPTPQPAPRPEPSQPKAQPAPQATTPEQKFKEEERVAQEVLKRLQDEKLKQAQKPRWAL